MKLVIVFFLFIVFITSVLIFIFGTVGKDPDLMALGTFFGFLSGLFLFILGRI